MRASELVPRYFLAGELSLVRLLIGSKHYIGNVGVAGSSPARGSLR